MCVVLLYACLYLLQQWMWSGLEYITVIYLMIMAHAKWLQRHCRAGPSVTARCLVVSDC